MQMVEGTTHGRRAVVLLREMIVKGEFPGGSRLFEVSLTEKLYMSRTPVREALSRLAEEGLLERLPNGGFVVRRFGYRDVVDAIELRGVMEGVAARLAAERGVTQDMSDALRRTVDELDGCFGPGLDDVDFDRYAQGNEAFHQHLAQACGSEVIRREVERAVALPFASPSAFLPSGIGILAFSRSLRRAQEQHHGLVEAVLAREGARAEALAREHARIARANVDYLFHVKPDLIDKIPGLALVER